MYKDYHKEYYRRNREKILAQLKENYERKKKQKLNKTSSDDYFKEYYQKNKHTAIFLKGKCREKTKRIKRDLEKLKLKSEAFKKSLQNEIIF